MHVSQGSLAEWSPAKQAAALLVFGLHERAGRGETRSLGQDGDHRRSLLHIKSLWITQLSLESVVSENLLMRQISIQVYFQKSGS